MIVEENIQQAPNYLVLLVGAGCVLFAVAAVLMVLVSLLRRGKRRPESEGENLTIDLHRLQVEGPPTIGLQLEFYGVPVRLVVFVLAPPGRGSIIPPRDNLRGVVENLLPGFTDVLDAHQPIYRAWPKQLSSQGFYQTFFNNLQLPGDKGKGTTWCSVVGRFDYGGGHLLAGMVCRSERPNALSQVIVEHEGQWHEVLRIRKERT